MALRSGAEWWRPDLAVDADSRPRVESAVPFGALMCFTFILLLAPQAYFPVLKPFRIALVTATVAIAAHLLDRFAHRSPILVLTREIKVAACLLGWALLTLPFSYWPGGSLSFLVDPYLKTLTIFWLLASTVGTAERLRYFGWGLSLMTIPLALTGVGNYLSGSFVQAAGHPEVKRILGYDAPLTSNPNDLALVLNLILPLSVSLFLINQRPSVRIVLLGIILLDVIAVILTFSRGGFLTLATTFAVFMWRLLRGSGQGWVLVALLLALVSVPLLPSGYVDHLYTILDAQSDPTGSAQQRWTDAVSAVEFVLAQPIIGAGLGMNALALNEVRGPQWLLVHNVYLEYAVDLGIPGLVLFVLLLIGCLKAAMFVRRQSAGVPRLREIRYLAEGLQVGLIAFMVGGMFLPVAYHFYFYILAGLSLAARRVYEAEARGLPRAAVSSSDA